MEAEGRKSEASETRRRKEGRTRRRRRREGEKEQEEGGREKKTSDLLERAYSPHENCWFADPTNREV